MQYFKKISRRLVDAQTRVLLTVFYIFLGPIAAIMSRVTREKVRAGWSDWKHNNDTVSDAQKQY